MTRLEDDIRAALLPGKANDDERAAWAREALARAPMRRRLHVLWPILAAAAILVAVFWPPEETKPIAPPVQAEEEPADEEEDEAAKRLNSITVAEQRARNLEFLEKSRTLKDARDGYWAIVVGGDSMHIAKTIDDAIAWADKLYPEAKHRFLFQIGKGPFTRGDVIGDRGPVALGTGGLFFFDHAGLKVTGDRVARGDKLVKVNGKDVALDLEVNGTPMRIRLDRESLATLVLPAGTRFPLAEIPGRLILEDMDRNWRTFRRYLVRVRHEELGLDTWVEAAGAESADRYAPGNWIAARFGGQVFHALRKDPAEQALEEGDAIVVLHIAKGSSEYLNELFDKVDVENHAQYAVPQARRTEVKCYDAKGRLTASLELPDASDRTVRALRKVLSAPPPADLLALINDQRRKNGVAPLVRDKLLTKAAQAHADEMARLGYFGHHSPTPGNRSPDDRLQAVGWGGKRVFQELLSQAKTSADALRSWNSKSLHSADFKVAGVGRSGRLFVLLLGEGP